VTNYIKHFTSLFTTQTERARADQVMNSEGGYVFAVDKWARLDRWLILGAEGGTYYAKERELTRDNAKTIAECLGEDGMRTVARIVATSESGRAPRNDTAIFALAMAAGDANLETRRAALAALPRVCRTGTDLFHFVRDVEGFRKWGRGLRTAIAGWYNDMPASRVAYQAVKYRERDGFCHRDLLRLAHPKAKTPEHDALYRWIIGGEGALSKETPRGKPLDPQALPAFVRAYGELRTMTDKKRVIAMIRDHRFTHEMLLTEWKNDPDIWAALLPDMPPGALLRNLGKMTSLGLLAPMSSASKLVCQRLTEQGRLTRARIHPIAVLSALEVYEQGHGERARRRANALTWTPVREIVDALNEAFHLAFDNIEPTGKKHLLALDVSSSMNAGAISGVPGLTPRIATAAMAMATARVEPEFAVVAFTAAPNGYGGQWGGGVSGITPLPLSPKQRLDDVLRTVHGLPFGGTDCALPMIWARENKVPVDTFVIYTDNETWAGAIQPFQALREYRQKMARPAKLIVVAMTSTGFTLADPTDAGMLDVVGFDASAPQVMADFTRG